MSRETDFIACLRSIATHPAARGLVDDAAVLEVGAANLVLTTDLLVEGVHYLPDDPPEDVAWKLVAANLSDLAGKGARPLGVLLGFTLGEAEWNRAFAMELGEALAGFETALLGGDTVAGAGARTLSMTAVGTVEGSVPARSGAQAGDALWVSGTIGDAGGGLAMLLGELPPNDALIRRYRRPEPRLAAGQALVRRVSAMMDVSDGVLLDAARMAEASGCSVAIHLDTVPLSADFAASVGADRAARLRAVTAGDDYELLFAAAPDEAGALEELAERLGLPLTMIGRFDAGRGLSLQDAAGPIALPPRLGYEHG